VRAVQTAAEAAVAGRVLLRADADRLIAQARESAILPAAAAEAVARCDRAAIADRMPAGTAVQAASFRGDRGYCEVKASASSGPGSLITFEVWVPGVWNGKLVATGNGGYDNVPSAGAMNYAVLQGYAAV